MRRWWKRLSPSWIILTLALLPATYYLWLPGLQTTMDGLYHKSRFFELDWLLRMGTLYPRWLPHQGFLYGFPTLHFYAPLIYYIAEGFHLLGWGFLASYEWMIGLGMVAAGWTMFYFARRWGPTVGWLAAIAYTYWVYHFSLAYVRGAQAELWAMVWYPLILAFVHHVVRRPSPFPGNRHLALALSYALLMLTHNLSVLLFTPVAIAYALWLLLWDARTPNRRERLTPLAHTVMSLAWGAGLAAFYWIPVLADIKYVRAGHTHQEGLTGLLQSLVPLQNLLLPYWFHPRQPLQGVQGIEPRGQVALCVWMGGALLMPFLWKRWTRERRSQVSFFLLLTVGAILGMSTWSRWFWKTLPFFYYVQFPWRLESLVGLGLALSVGLIWGDVVGRAPRIVRGRWGQYALLGGLTLALGVSGLGGIPYDIAKNPATWQPLREEDV
ncbi:MAG: hypothetical protein GXO55_08080, partial [Chloroflexi bacterium]|nr:hypothetical protein [Chloroflexota bacterium]